MTQIQKKIYITRGDDTNFNEDKFLKFILNTERDLTDWSAMFTLGGNTYKFTDIASKTFEVTISAEDSQKIPYGLNMGSVYLFDNKSRRKTLTISIPFQVEKKPTFNTFSTLEVVAEPVEIQLQVGEPIPTKTSDLVNDSGFITKDVDDLAYYTKTEDMEALIDSKGFITKDVDDLTNSFSPCIMHYCGVISLTCYLGFCSICICNTITFTIISCFSSYACYITYNIICKSLGTINCFICFFMH